MNRYYVEYKCKTPFSSNDVLDIYLYTHSEELVRTIMAEYEVLKVSMMSAKYRRRIKNGNSNSKK